jgi:hypothetical protein
MLKNGGKANMKWISENDFVLCESNLKKCLDWLSKCGGFLEN